MKPIRLVAIALIIAGVLGLAYGGFSYTSETHDVDIGPVEFSVSEKESVAIPVWLGAASVIAGVLLLVVRVRS